MIVASVSLTAAATASAPADTTGAPAATSPDVSRVTGVGGGTGPLPGSSLITRFSRLKLLVSRCSFTMSADVSGIRP